MDQKKTVAFQGMRGAYSEQACREKMSEWNYLHCKTFEEGVIQVESGQAALAPCRAEYHYGIFGRLWGGPCETALDGA